MKQINTTLQDTILIAVIQTIIKTAGFCLVVALSFRGILNFLGGVNPGRIEHYLNVITDPFVSLFSNHSVSQQSAFGVPIMVSIVFVVVAVLIVYAILSFIKILLNSRHLASQRHRKIYY